MTRMRSFPLAFQRVLVSGSVVLVAAACSPTFDWREVQPKGADDQASGLVAMFPCRPSHEVRDVPVAGRTVKLAIDACRTGDTMFAVSTADVGDPRVVGAALDALRTAALGNLRGQVLGQQRAQVDGATPYAQALALRIAGRMPDGASVEERLALFAHGTRVYQATVFGAHLPPDVGDPFFGGLHLPR